MSAPPSSDLLARLEARLGADALIVDSGGMAPYLTDWRRLMHGRALAVVRPRDAAQVSAVARLCHETATPIVPQGGNTDMAMAATPPPDGKAILLSLSRMKAIRSLDPVAMTMEVEAGCVLRVAKDAAEAQNRFLPVTIGAEGSAQIGGIVSTNAGGVNVLRYGMTRAAVLGLEVVLADGTILSGLRRLRKDNAGYDWKQLFIGAEGTLGMVTAAVMRLSPKPRHTVSAFIGVESAESALTLLALAQDELGDALSVFELIASSCLVLVEKHFGLTPPIAPAGFYVLMEAASMIGGVVAATETTLAEAIEKNLAADAAIAQNAAQAASFWALRERISEAELREGVSAKHDVSVPIERMAEFLHAAETALAQRFPQARPNPFGHLGDGNLHYNVLTGGAAPDEINDCVHELVAGFGGSISAEHGIGRYRVGELRKRKSAEELALMRRIKAMLDPDGLFNPGAVL